MSSSTDCVAGVLSSPPVDASGGTARDEMAFDVKDYLDLVRLLREHPKWELRRLVLTDELLTIPGLVRELAEAQRRTEERVGRLEAVMEELAEVQWRTQEEIRALELTIKTLRRVRRAQAR